MKASCGNVCLVDRSKRRVLRRFAARGSPLASGIVRDVAMGPRAKRIVVNADAKLVSCVDSTGAPSRRLSGSGMQICPGPMGPRCGKLVAMSKLACGTRMGVAAVAKRLICSKRTGNKLFA